MLRRAFFIVSLGLTTISAVAAIAMWALVGEISPGVAVGALVGGAFLVAAMALALREMLQGLWKVARSQSAELKQVAGLRTSLRRLNDDQLIRDDLILAEIVKLKKRTRKLESSQTQQLASINRINRRQKDARDQSREVVSGLERIDRRQKSAEEQSLDAAAVLRRLDHRQIETIKPALERIELNADEKMRPLLRKIEREQMAGYRQIESLVSLLTALDLRSPLPHMRQTWAIDPDSAAFLVKTIFERTPQNVVELGSGISTVLVARALQIIGSGHFRSIEQDSRFLQQTQDLLRAEGLEDRVELVEAQIADVVIGDSSWRWYSPEGVDGLESVDLIIVDGPPSRTGEQARYPAVPVLADLMTEGALVFLDDADREDERSVVERWLSEFPLAALEVPRLEKGAALLEWRP